MKRPLLSLVAGVAIVLTGCVVTSVYPYYTDRDIIFEAALLGDWVDAEADIPDNEFCRIEKFGDSGYRLTYFGRNETNSCEGRLFRLNGQLFLDTCPTNRALDELPVHQLQKVRRTDAILETVSLNYDWLTKLLEKNPKALRHIVVTDKNGDREDNRIVLTADTADLQKFVLKHLNNTNAWNEPSALKICPVASKAPTVAAQGAPAAQRSTPAIQP